MAKCCQSPDADVPAEICKWSLGLASPCKASSTDDTASHSSGTAAVFINPEPSSGSSGEPASPTASSAGLHESADALADATPDAAAAACCQGRAASEAAAAAAEEFPVAGFSRKDTPYVCQVPGCGRDLGREKPYYRRYRVCRLHAAAKEVGTPGDKRRYCQQCSIFHSVAEFDDEKRTCRARLQWHNSKRRKKTETVGAAAANARPAAAVERKATRSRSTTLDTALQGALAVSAANADTKPPAAMPAAKQLPKAAAPPAKRRSLGSSSGSPVAKASTSLVPFTAFPKGRRSNFTAAATTPASPAAAQQGTPEALAPAAAAAMPALQALAPGSSKAGAAVAVPCGPAVAAQLFKAFTLPQPPIGALLAPPPLQASTLDPPICSFGATAVAAGPLPPPGHAWSTVQPLPQQPSPLQQQQQQQKPQQQAPLQQQPLMEPLPAERQAPSAGSSSGAASWHSELLQMPPDWDGQLPEDAPDAGGLPAPLQGGAELPPLQGVPGLADGVVPPLPEARDPLEDALLPPPSPADCQAQLAAAAAQFPAVAAAAAAAWGVPWPPPQPLQQQSPQAGGADHQLPSTRPQPQPQVAQRQQCAAALLAADGAPAAIERLSSNPTPLHNWAVVPSAIEPPLPDLPWSLSPAGVPLQGSQAMEVDPLMPLPPPTDPVAAMQPAQPGSTGATGPCCEALQAAQLCGPVMTALQMQPAPRESQQQMRRSASDSSTHCSQAQLLVGRQSAAVEDVWDQLLPDDMWL